VLRAAGPGQLTHEERDGRHVVALARPLEATDERGAFLALESARLVVDADTFRPLSIEAAGLIAGEAVRFDAAVESVELLSPGELTEEAFSITSPEDAVRLSGPGSDYPVADVLSLLFDQAGCAAAPPSF
jgi:hypothetical protein